MPSVSQVSIRDTSNFMVFVENCFAENSRLLSIVSALLEIQKNVEKKRSVLALPQPCVSAQYVYPISFKYTDN